MKFQTPHKNDYLQMLVNDEQIEDDECNCSDCMDARNPTRQRYGEWAGTGNMSNDTGPLP